MNWDWFDFITRIVPILLLLWIAVSAWRQGRRLHKEYIASLEALKEVAAAYHQASDLIEELLERLREGK